MKIFRTLELAIQFNTHVSSMKLSGHLRDQLLRAASSIALNLTEGNAKFSVKEKKRYYQIAYGSQKECQTILRLIQIQDAGTEKLLDHLGASIYKLLHASIPPVRSEN